VTVDSKKCSPVAEMGDRLATIDMGQKLGGGCDLWGELGYVTLCSMWTQLPPEKGHTHPHPVFGPRLLWPNGWIDEDAAWYGSRPRPRRHFTRQGPSSRKRGTAAPLFAAHCLLWPRSPILATAEVLSDINISYGSAYSNTVKMKWDI